MDIGILIGIVVGFASMIVAFIAEGGVLSALLQPTAALIVFGGTIGAVMVSFPLAQIKKIPSYFKVAFSSRKGNIQDQIEYFKKISSVSRKEGLLSLESHLQDPELNSFMRKGLQMLIDGVDGESIRASLETRLENLNARHEVGGSVFEAAGGFGPTMGIIGTVMGLVHVLSDLSDPDTLGPKIAVAFIATLYGVASANLLWLPIASKLKVVNEEEIIECQLIIEGLLLLQEGTNTNLLVGRLEGFLEEKQAEKLEAVEGN
ncbi:flagellar motor protein [Clostridium sp. LY3-2]|uniref:flagellar motor protein n=1 Tax=Clostridium sp. LY3-2 TaxID=2942482 RepID=UPI00215393F0|nr:flagellar motor protein [Clostridium sp. LY3-2]MCR6515144.1 flagellar motor protein [Clostridium sp. LY3-2]